MGDLRFSRVESCLKWLFVLCSCAFAGIREPVPVPATIVQAHCCLSPAGWCCAINLGSRIRLCAAQRRPRGRTPPKRGHGQKWIEVSGRRRRSDKNLHIKPLVAKVGKLEEVLERQSQRYNRTRTMRKKTNNSNSVIGESFSN